MRPGRFVLPWQAFAFSLPLIRSIGAFLSVIQCDKLSQEEGLYRRAGPGSVNTVCSKEPLINYASLQRESAVHCNKACCAGNGPALGKQHNAVAVRCRPRPTGPCQDWFLCVALAGQTDVWRRKRALTNQSWQGLNVCIINQRFPKRNPARECVYE